MRFPCFAVSALIGLFLSSASAAPLSYFLPEGSYDEKIPTPSSVLGHEVGEWHLRPDQLVTYLEAVAEASDRVVLEQIGRTHEARPLLMLAITDPANHERLEEIRKAHLELTDPAQSGQLDTGKMPVVVNMGYGVHGNESSASNASILVAYHLAASNAKETREFLKSSVILLDPCLNPDGFGRFAQWANSHRGKLPIASADSREHNEVWPGGRTNHYWFDLNRDWLLGQHPESRARLRKFHQWRPNVVTDFHEMGSDSTYFFQPGVKARKHPLTPGGNVRLTERFAKYHARSLDEIGTVYFNEEKFDDFYYGKGSTYPDVHGAVGILFEQASSRGHLRESIHGEFDFAYTIRNQVRTSFSTLEAAADMRKDLLDYQREFSVSALQLAEADPVKAWVFGSNKDPVSNYQMLTLLRRHRIEVRELGQGIQGLKPGSAYGVLARQPQYRLIKALFEQRTEFEDSVFYDVSAWTMPLAMGIPFLELKEIPDGLLGEVLVEVPFPSARPPLLASVAYAFEWHGQMAPRALNRLHEADVLAKVTTRPVVARSRLGTVKLDRGSVIIPLGLQKEATALEIRAVLRVIAEKDGIRVHDIHSSLTPEGIDLGSPGVLPLKKPVPLLVTGAGVSGYEAGEVWHLLDHRHDTEIALVDHARLSSANLDSFTHVIMVGGKYELSSKKVTLLKNWITRGGILIVTKSAARWAGKHGIGTAKFLEEASVAIPAHGEAAKRRAKVPGKSPDAGQSGDQETKVEAPPTKPIKRLPYDRHQHERDSKLTKGAIFSTDLDTTHPLGYGYTSRDLAVFRNSNLVMHPSRDPYATVALYSGSPLLAGYVHKENGKKIKNSAAVIAERLGKGAVISFVDNPNFRAFWTGTSRMFLNAIFLGSTIEKTVPVPEDNSQDEHGRDH